MGVHGYRMSWDETWLTLQELRVNACLKGDGNCRSFRIVSHRSSDARGSDASSWGCHPCLILLSPLDFLLESGNPVLYFHTPFLCQER